MNALKDTKTFGKLRLWPQCLSLLPLTILVIFIGVEISLAEDQTAAVEFPGKLPEMDFSKIKPLVEKSGLASAFIEKQLRQRRLELEDVEGRLKDFKQNNGLISLDVQRSLLLTQRQDLDTSLKSAQNQAEGLNQKLAWLKNQLIQTPDRVPLSSVSGRQSIINQAKSNLLSLQLEEQELLTKYQVSHRRITGLRKEIQLIQDFLKAQGDQLEDKVTTGKNPLYQNIELDLVRTEAELVSVKAQSEVIKQQIQEVDQELARLASLENRLQSMRREVADSERNYLDYLTKVGATPTRDYRIQVGDRLDIKFFFNPELNEEVLVRPDGRIALQLVGEISVAGKTVEELRKTLIQGYDKQLKNPEIAIILRSNISLHLKQREKFEQRTSKRTGREIKEMDTNFQEAVRMERSFWHSQGCPDCLFKHKVSILTVFLIVLIPVTLWIILSVPIYEAYSSILLKIGREHIYRPEVGTSSPSLYIEREAAIQSEIEILKSEDLVKKVLRTFGVQNIYPDLVKDFPTGEDPMPAATGIFLGNLDVRRMPQAQMSLKLNLNMRIRRLRPKLSIWWSTG